MSRPDLAQEPSMEEILASIRKIIAEDPPAERPMPDLKLKTPAASTPAAPVFSAPSNGEPLGAAKASPSSPFFARTSPSPTGFGAPSTTFEKQNGHSAVPATAPATAPMAPSSSLIPAAPVAAKPVDDDLDDLLDDAPAAKAAPMPPVTTPTPVSAAQATPKLEIDPFAALPAGVLRSNVSFTRTTIAPHSEAPAASAPPPGSKMPATSRAFLEAFPRGSVADPRPVNPLVSVAIETPAAKPAAGATTDAVASDVPATAERVAATTLPATTAPSAAVIDVVVETPFAREAAALRTVVQAASLAPAPGPVSEALAAAVTKTSETPASRTMEDTVSELLRPMLRQWLTENMPKIIEKALLSELRDNQR